MATTTNFGWETPDDTDLVKDGALAMRTLGNAIDASLVDLKGGTTGQVLSKTSNTDMDFTWVTSDDANAIQNAIVDAKGDLIAASAADTPARLAVGNNGETLVADSSASTGLRWQPIGLANPVINSCMDVWQRGTSFTAAGLLYCADRWTYWRDAYASGITASRQLTNDTSLLPFVQYCLRIQRDSGNTGTGVIYSNQPIENVNSTPFIGQTVTVSAYMRRGANFSASNNYATLLLRSGTGTDQPVNNMTGATTVAINNQIALTTSWVRYSITGTVSSSAKQLGLEINYTPTGTAGANDYIEFTGVQIDLGSVAQPLRRSGGTLAGELAACQRYYFRITPGGNYNRFSMAQALSATAANAIVQFPVAMRVAPTALEQSGTASHYAVSNSTYGALLALTSVPAFDRANNYNASVSITCSTGLSAGNATQFVDNNTSSAYLGWSAEL